MAEPILKIENLKANYGSIVAIKGIDFEVYEGEIVTIIGANGAGKTTLLSCISGLMPYEGSITYKGEKLGGKIDSAAIVERGIVQIPEGRQIFSDLSVLENLKMGAYTRKKGDDIERTSGRSMTFSPDWKRERTRRAEAFPAVSSRCLPWAGL